MLILQKYVYNAVYISLICEDDNMNDLKNILMEHISINICFVLIYPYTMGYSLQIIQNIVN